MITIGLTGGIGSGKSTVAQMFRELGVPVYDSDAEAKQLMTTSPDVKAGIISLLGEQAYDENQLNRDFIANKAFSNKDILEKLNAIVHPVVREHFYQWRKEQSAPYVIQESALIFENGIQDQYDLVILVTAPLQMRVERVVERDQVSQEKVHYRIKNQMDDQLKIELADFLIENTDWEATQKKVNRLHTTLLKLAEPRF
ncbi:dephospho-CoA kinase [Muricauda sp. JGD-17]|uniref:Dephospho-CoA kinase n=1 Tax=Flagellimonas ochracea TaxID=2696472 RepID=A0A964WW86_9FLAO|nr:dephospho-CoA kinase [Allomuricauda ochracea]NAY90715.1 dephospho-CoA kinase [Allomuricauda ochracea]